MVTSDVYLYTTRRGNGFTGIEKNPTAVFTCTQTQSVVVPRPDGPAPTGRNKRAATCMVSRSRTAEHGQVISRAPDSVGDGLLSTF